MNVHNTGMGWMGFWAFAGKVAALAVIFLLGSEALGIFRTFVETLP